MSLITEIISVTGSTIENIIAEINAKASQFTEIIDDKINSIKEFVKTKISDITGNTEEKITYVIKIVKYTAGFWKKKEKLEVGIFEYKMPAVCGNGMQSYKKIAGSDF